MSIGETIKKYRKEKKLTQKELATLIKKSESTVRKYESGSVTPDIKSLTMIAKVFNRTLNDLLTLNEEYLQPVSTDYLLKELEHEQNYKEDMEASSVNIGATIKKYRKENKLTQPNLARLIGKSDSTIQKYESGSAAPDIKTLNIIAAVLEVPITELLTLNEVPLIQEEPKFTDLSQISTEDLFTNLHNILEELKKRTEI
jgi:transcriptional regulator with XRE-family HTH domain